VSHPAPSGASSASGTERYASVDDIRAEFPALARTDHGQPVAFFDGPGGTQTPRAVVDAVAGYLLQHNANTHWAYPTSHETDALIADARAVLAAFVNARPEEIAFGANMTTLTFHLARALARGWAPGDEVVVTALDHHANVDPWRHAAREHQTAVRVVDVDTARGTLDWRSLEASLTPRTRIVAVGAASNAIGTITDVGRIAELARARGALVFVDAVHYAPHALVDVEAFDCDFLACSAYKVYGPHIGVLYGRHDRLVALDVPKLQPAPNAPPERLETGTQNHEGIAGAAAAVRFLASLAGAGGGGDAPSPGNEPGSVGRPFRGAISAERDRLRQRLRIAFDVLHARGSRQLARLWDGLTGIPGVAVYGPPPEEPRTPTLSFTVSGVPSHDVAAALADRGVYVSHGDFYASTLVERLGLADQGLVRVGCVCSTTMEEVERVIEGVKEIARQAPPPISVVAGL
jgi:cysteine desulfurase family protein (TIGR01976 family)